ncbi:MAG: endo-1,4-beta-xylanase [Bacteroidales bacterium]|nr:endo-1,4-beta-xylanase [Bacteroidales bacterium]
MRKLLTYAVAAAVLSGCSQPDKNDRTLKDEFQGKFYIGAAINEAQITGADSAGQAVVLKHFNSIVAENCMKCEEIHPEQNRYNFSVSDKFVELGEKNGMFIIGHCLVWHSQTAPWCFVDNEGKQVSYDTLKQRIKDHIYTVVGRYKGRVKGWDVVNEAILDDGTYRNSPLYQIMGEDFIPWAFQCAHEADPDAELYYNDYAMHKAPKADAIVTLVKKLQNANLRIDGVGMQSHFGLDFPSFEDYETSLKKFAALGVHVMATEWDMNALPTMSSSSNIGDTLRIGAIVNKSYQKGLLSDSPSKVSFDKITIAPLDSFKAKFASEYPDSVIQKMHFMLSQLAPYPVRLPDTLSKRWNDRMAGFLAIWERNADVVTRVTAWGVSDGESWKNDFPVKGRHEYPLLFDRDHQLKPFLQQRLSGK